MVLIMTVLDSIENTAGFAYRSPIGWLPIVAWL